VRDQLTRNGLGALLALAGVALLALVLAYEVPDRPQLALGAAALLLVAGFVLSAPALLLAAVYATVFLPWRVGPGSLQMSVCDAVTLLAMLAALPYVPWRKRALHQVLAGLAIYLGILVVVVASHPTRRAEFEFAHRAVLFGGTVLIGAAVAHRHQVASSLKALVSSSVIISFGAIYSTLTTGLQPGYPFGINKNLAGSLLAITIVLLVAAPGRTGIRWSWIRHIRILCIVGLLATQSRGAILAVVAVTAIYALRHRSARRRAPLFFLTVALVLIGVSFVTLRNEYIDNPQFNAIDTRTVAFDDAINNVWLVHPITGAGLRYFQANDSADYITAGVHNIVLAELSEGGVIALLGLIVLLWNTVRVVMRRRDTIGEAAFLILVCQILFGMTDIFWVAGSLSLAMLIVGIAIGEDTELERRASPRAVPTRVR
jgi:hypothetical protein